jgi:acyl-CoA thioesterase FadM
MQPVYERLAEQFTTGKWGMVTNHAETSILGSAKASDVIEARVWLDRLYGPMRSTTDLFYEWSKVLPDGARELVALSKMCTTWVAIREHGVVEAQPFPDYVLDYMESVLPENDVPKVAHNISEQVADVDLGCELYAGPSGPINKVLLREQVFDTSLEDANLVGNIYFANYYVWQGRIRDHFLYELLPERFRGTGEAGELRCLYSKIEHLREAMPFERVMIKMSLGRVHEKGVQMLFEYYRLTADGRQEKLAFGEQRAAWFTPTVDGRWIPALLPSALRNGLLLETEVEQVA